MGEGRGEGTAIVLGSVEPTLRTFGIPQRGQIIFQMRPWDWGGDPFKGNTQKFFVLKDGYDNAAVPAGQYALKTFHISSSITSYAFGGWSRPDEKTIGRFDVREGDVIYIGHLVFEPDGNRLAMRVEDRFDEYRKDLPDSLASKVEKNLIALPPSVTFPQQRKTRIMN